MIAVMAKVTPYTEKVGVPLLIAIIGLIGAIAAAAISIFMSRWNENTARRRDGYATATKELVAWAEYPYRIRRRTSDAPDVLAELVTCGHNLQEALRYRQTWIATENAWVATVFSEVRADITCGAGAAAKDAWSNNATSSPADMNLNGWTIHGIDDHLGRLENAIRFRFGWRRVISSIGWHPGAMARPATASFTSQPPP